MKQTLLLFFLSCLLSFGMQAQSADSPILASTTQLKKNIRIFPNPTSDFINLSDSDGVANIKILNLIGREVKNFVVTPDRDYSVEDLDNGMYFIQLISTENKVITTKRLRKL